MHFWQLPGAAAAAVRTTGSDQSGVGVARLPEHSGVRTQTAK